MLRCWVIALACCTAIAAQPSAADLARAVRQAGFDPDQCYRVHELSFQKEDIRIYLTDGYLIFGKPIMGEPRAALFVDDVEGGDAELILLPPYRGERQSLAAFTESANLDEHFRTALMIFTDDTGKLLKERMAQDGSGRKAAEMGALLAAKWTPVLFNIQGGYEMRLVTDLLSPVPPPPAPRPGILLLTLSGRRMGTFDVVYDPFSRDEIMAGQGIDRDGKHVYNVWTSFASRGRRTGVSKPPEPWFFPTSYTIDAALDADLRMTALSQVDVRIGSDPIRVFPFSIAPGMRVTAVRIDGAPVELFFQSQAAGPGARGAEGGGFLAVSPQPLAASSVHRFEFEHEGAVVAAAGGGVYFAASRSNWYPRSSDNFATFDLTFRYPKRLTLVAPGDQVEDRIDGDLRITRRRTPVPIRLAGFNLGDYEKVLGSAAGYTVEVYGNRHLETALQPRLRESPPSTTPPPSPGGRGGRFNVPEKPDLPNAPDPLARLRTVTSDVSSALEFFTARFGPPALKTLTIAPIPGSFGQGFPGLVYLPTLTYLDPSEVPGMRNPQRRLSATDLIEAHEVAHQWWGNVVTSASYQDDWLLEAMASYSSLLFLEKNRGAKAVDGVLDEYRSHLLIKDAQDHTIESAGPITWGTRLNSATNADTWNVITYEKGAWILHMLRRRIGDERFLKLLAEVRKRYEFKHFSTEDFRVMVKEFRAPGMSTAAIDEFFDNWMYSTGIPSIKLTYTVKGVAPAFKLSGSVEQSGVDDDFTAQIPVEIQFAKGAPQTIWVPTGSDAADFSATLKEKPVRVSVAQSNVLVTKR